MAIRVRAIDPGYFGYLRNVGDEFLIANEKQFSKKWMVKVDEDVEAGPAEKAAPASAPKAKPASKKKVKPSVDSEPSKDEGVI